MFCCLTKDGLLVEGEKKQVGWCLGYLQRKKMKQESLFAVMKQSLWENVIPQVSIEKKIQIRITFMTEKWIQISKKFAQIPKCNVFQCFLGEKRLKVDLECKFFCIDTFEEKESNVPTFSNKFSFGTPLNLIGDVVKFNFTTSPI